MGQLDVCPIRKLRPDARRVGTENTATVTASANYTLESRNLAIRVSRTM